MKLIGIEILTCVIKMKVTFELRHLLSDHVYCFNATYFVIFR